MRRGLLLLLILTPLSARADQIGDWISTLEKKQDEKARLGLIEGPREVDGRIMQRLKVFAASKKGVRKDGVQTLVSVLDHRRNYAKPSAFQDQGIEGAKVILQLVGAYGINPGLYLADRGGPMYELLITVANSDRPEHRFAISKLTEIAWALPAGKKGDPKLIAVFRKDKNYAILGHLGDRASIPAMKAALQSQNPHEQFRAALGLAKLGDEAGVIALIPMMGSDSELMAGRQNGGIGEVVTSLRQYAKPKHADQVLAYAKKVSGLPRAFALNVLGVIGSSKHIASIRAFEKDPGERVKQAAKNAIKQIQSRGKK